MSRMKSYSSFDEYVADQNPKHQAVIRVLREFVRKTTPDLIEAVKWGNGCWIGTNGPVAYVHTDARTDYVQFGFFHGAFLKDPNGLLEGKGQYVRHTKVCDPSAIDQGALAALLRQAASPRKGRGATARPGKRSGGRGKV